MTEVERRDLYIQTKAELRREGKENPAECILYLAEELHYARKLGELYLKDIDELNKQLEGKMAEVYPDFMRDYEIMRHELLETQEELAEAKRALREAGL